MRFLRAILMSALALAIFLPQPVKAVFHVEYVVGPEDFCPRTIDLGFSSLRKRWALGAWHIPCV